MSCKYCLNRETLLEKDDVIDSTHFRWCSEISIDEVLFDAISVFIDREHLRLVDPQDTQCLDHGEKIKINYCPMCGEKLK